MVWGGPPVFWTFDTLLVVSLSLDADHRSAEPRCAFFHNFVLSLHAGGVSPAKAALAHVWFDALCFMLASFSFVQPWVHPFWGGPASWTT